MQQTIERPDPGRGLSARILALTVAFVLLGEVLIFVPSIARFRLAYLDQMVAAADLATLAIAGHPDRTVDAALEETLLEHVGARAVTLWRPEYEVMLGSVGPVDRIFDLRERSPVTLVLDALQTLVARNGRQIRVVGVSPHDPSVQVDVIFDESDLRHEMIGYASRILALSVVLSVIVAALLFMGLRGMIVRPLAFITARLALFRMRPEDATTDITPSGRRDEIGIVERELQQMQRELRRALKQQMRLAALGAAVGRVSHDLKNILSSAVLISDRIETSADPQVRELAPRLVGTLERAIRLCTQTLRFARENLPEPRFETVALRPLVLEVASAVCAEAPQLTCHVAIDPNIAVRADRDQLYRVFLNLARNSREALGDRPGELRWASAAADGQITVSVADNGPGIPPVVRSRLFTTFSGSTKPDGSGLGLAICREIMRTHGGNIELLSTGEEGTRFQLVLPAAA